MTETNQPIAVVIADDHPMIREGLRTMLLHSHEVSVVGEASNGKELIQAVDELGPQVILVDVRMPDMDGISAVREIRARHPEVKAMMLTVHDEEHLVHEALAAGASGYMLKNVDVGDLIRAVKTIADGKAFLHPEITQSLITQIEDVRPKPRAAKNLSQRERDVLQLLAFGKSNKEIARELGIGSQTVKTHVSHIFTKLGAADRTGAVATALRKGLVE